MALFSIERRSAPSLVERRSCLSLLDREERVSSSTERRECLSLLFREERDSFSIDRRELICLAVESESAGTNWLPLHKGEGAASRSLRGTLLSLERRGEVSPLSSL